MEKINEIVTETTKEFKWIRKRPNKIYEQKDRRYEILKKEMRKSLKDYRKGTERCELIKKFQY